MKDVLFLLHTTPMKSKRIFSPFLKGYIYCKEYNRNKCYARSNKKNCEGRYNSNVFGIFAYLHIVI